VTPPARFERAEGTPLVPLPPFRLEDRVVETLVAGDADTWVVLPALDEVGGIGATLAALEAQTLRPFVVCVVDNGSRDGTPDLVRRWAASVAAPGGPRRGLGVRLVVEPEKGLPERMWVVVTAVSDVGLAGTFHSDAVEMIGLHAGDAVQFERRHVVAIGRRVAE